MNMNFANINLTVKRTEYCKEFSLLQLPADNLMSQIVRATVGMTFTR